MQHALRKSASGSFSLPPWTTIGRGVPSQRITSAHALYLVVGTRENMKCTLLTLGGLSFLFAALCSRLSTRI